MQTYQRMSLKLDYSRIKYKISTSHNDVQKGEVGMMEGLSIFLSTPSLLSLLLSGKFYFYFLSPSIQILILKKNNSDDGITI